MRLAILTALALAATGCDDTRVITTPAPLPTASPTPGEGGTCGDGVILRPGEQCP